MAARQGKDWSRYKNCKGVWEAIQNFGTDDIKQEILFEGEMSPEEASRQERFYIDKYDTTNPEHGYNRCRGGGGLSEKHLSEDRIAQLREQMHEQGLKRTSVVVSEETKEKQRQMKLGVKRGPMSEETKNKISKANSLENMSEETRLRRSQSKQKRVVATEHETDKTMRFDSVESAAEFFGVESSAVSRWIYGKRKPRNNYSFQFEVTNND